MDKFKLIYQLLRFVELSADKDEFDASGFTAAHFKVERNEFLNAVEMMIDAKYIKGVELREAIDGRVDLFVTRPELMLDGFKFLLSSITNIPQTILFSPDDFTTWKDYEFDDKLRLMMTRWM